MYAAEVDIELAALDYKIDALALLDYDFAIVIGGVIAYSQIRAGNKSDYDCAGLLVYDLFAIDCLSPDVRSQFQLKVNIRSRIKLPAEALLAESFEHVVNSSVRLDQRSQYNSDYIPEIDIVVGAEVDVQLYGEIQAVQQIGYAANYIA